jgi:hypothetical protein
MRLFVGANKFSLRRRLCLEADHWSAHSRAPLGMRVFVLANQSVAEGHWTTYPAAPKYCLLCLGIAIERFCSHR